jgi:hypothetical protein
MAVRTVLIEVGASVTVNKQPGAILKTVEVVQYVFTRIGTATLIS